MLPHHAIAQLLPDLPRWVELRALLLWGGCEVYGLRLEPELSLVLRDPDTDELFVTGQPDAAAIHEAAAHGGSDLALIAPPEQASRLAQALPTWSSERIILYRLDGHERLPLSAPGSVGWLDIAALDQLAIPDDLRDELAGGAEHSPIAATFVQGQPVAFCYAGAITEAWWDVSIDTLPQHRRRGYAAACAAFMIRYMQARGQQPVWAALETNIASWRLAQRLGFVPDDELVMFEPRA